MFTMDERSYLPLGADQQRPSRPQYDVFQPQYIQTTRLVSPRERYRATQYDHPTYDAVEDDDYGQGEPLDSFGMYQAT
jgi:ATP-dependent DNA helicase HFM1/MER3